jgi:hypothetical protein
MLNFIVAGKFIDSFSVSCARRMHGTFFELEETFDYSLIGCVEA